MPILIPYYDIFPTTINHKVQLINEYLKKYYRYMARYKNEIFNKSKKINDFSKIKTKVVVICHYSEISCHLKIHIVLKIRLFV